MKKATAVFFSFAARPTATKISIRSCSRSPLSAVPGSSPSSTPNSMSWYFTFMAPTNPPRTRSAFFARVPAAEILSSFNNTDRSGGMSSAGKERFSGASMLTTTNPRASDSCAIRVSSTVFPTPRSPTSSRLRAGNPARNRSSAIAAFSIISSRPASSGGRVPAPGA